MRRILLALLVGLSGCTRYAVVHVADTRDDVAAPPPAETGRVCVLRPHRVAALVTLVVRDNGELVGATRGPGRFCWLAEPGKHHITSREDDDIGNATGLSSSGAAAEVAVEPGGRYYLHQPVSHLYGWGALEWVDEPTASEMAAECPYATVARVPANEALPRGKPVEAQRERLGAKSAPRVPPPPPPPAPPADDDDETEAVSR